jgi:hypothetical protein
MRAIKNEIFAMTGYLKKIFVMVIFKKKYFDVAELFEKKNHIFYCHVHEQRFTVAAFINTTYVIAIFINKRSVKENFLHEDLSC